MCEYMNFFFTIKFMYNWNIVFLKAFLLLQRHL